MAWMVNVATIAARWCVASTSHASINSAFIIFEVLGDHGKPCTLPKLQPEPLVSWPNCPNHEKHMYVCCLFINLSVC